MSAVASAVRTTKTAVFDAGAVAVVDVDLPDRQAGQVDVAINAAAICGSDLHTVLGHRSSPPRTALGHEGVGTVVDSDTDAADLAGAPLRRGDRVVFALFSACGQCDRCRSGLAMKCRSLLKYGHESVDTMPHATGTLASHVRLLPGVPILRISDDVNDVDMVSAGCAVATAAAAIAASGVTAVPSRALVLGAGAVGAYTAAMFATEGCDVQVRDPSDTRLKLALELGASPPDDDPAPFPLVVEASGNPHAFVEGLHACEIGGQMVAVGSVSPGSGTVEFDPAVLVTRRITLTGVHNYGPDDFSRAVAWLGDHGRRLGLDRLVSEPLPLDRVQEGFEWMQAGRYHRVLVRP